ncbi:MAG: formate dehydrogenase accessory sulfurtransferase FdhD [Arenimonas sp.]|nr:formate dehydrogenase accessory sulfurtransferase FdhD [Arenimonas sp.]
MQAAALHRPAAALAALHRLRHVGDAWHARAEPRLVPEEAAIAFVYDGVSHAVMMATPQDLEDFAVGFTLAERLVASAADIASVVPVHTGPDAWELRIGLAAGARLRAATSGVQRLTAPTGCGLCGVRCTRDALRALPAAGAAAQPAAWRAADIAQAMEALQSAQALNRQAHALHAAGLWRRDVGLLAVREDVGRHCALDKLAGALARQGTSAAGGAVLMTSRISLELVQKAARQQACLLVAVSAPTALAVRTAQAAGITLVALARGRDFEVYTHPQRLAGHGAPP